MKFTDDVWGIKDLEKKYSNAVVVKKPVYFSNIGHYVRIVKYPNTGASYPYAVEFRPAVRGGKMDPDNDWGTQELGPGSVESTFPTLAKATEFFEKYKKWKPTEANDDGLDYSQNLIRRINGY